MAKGIRFHETGGPEVMQWESLEVGEPGPGEVRVRHAAVGLNFADTYFRTGLYPAAAARRAWASRRPASSRPSARASPAFAEGDRVTYTGSPLGAYSTERVMPAAPLIKLPDVDPVRDRGRDDHARPDLGVPAAPHRPARARATPSCCTPPPAASA